MQGSSEQAASQCALMIESSWKIRAVELKVSGEFSGIIGLQTQAGKSGIPQAPLSEIVWRSLSAVHTWARVMRQKLQEWLLACL